MTEVTVRADPAHRRRVAILVLAILVAGGFGVSTLAQHLASLRDLAAESPELAAERFLDTARWVLAVPSIGLAISGLLLIPLGWRGWHSERFPPDGSRLLADQPLTTGREAKQRSALVLAFAIAAIVGAVLLPFFVHQRLAATLAGAMAMSERSID